MQGAIAEKARACPREGGGLGDLNQVEQLFIRPPAPRFALPGLPLSTQRAGIKGRGVNRPKADESGFQP